MVPMIDIPAAEVMTNQGLVVDPGCSIEEAASHLRDPGVAALIVRDSPDGIDGIVTEGDIVASVAEHSLGHPVKRCMSAPVVTVQPFTPVGLAADRMQDAGVSILPVLDESDDYRGLVTRRCLAPYLSRARLEIAWTGQPLTIDEPSVDAE